MWEILLLLLIDVAGVEKILKQESAFGLLSFSLRPKVWMNSSKESTAGIRNSGISGQTSSNSRK
jgi:hypothetical protein